MDEVMQFINGAGFYFIASVDSEGKPHLRPFGSRVINEGKFYIITNTPKAVYRQITENPFVELAAMNAERAWIRLAAKAVAVSSVDDREKIYGASGVPMPFNAQETAVFELTEAKATIYQGAEEKTITW
ncbi:MAG: pyridoxamine 5'-phosphate oxidase family protein [Coriobacteriales bacterium]|jgi:uncharacterized pyridoxamine 5'-phosphate oxidase family protein|nr:pyridoxamine 5'-phosphate oxidase family protein [Coriobacteriales bacterium]